MYVSNTISLSRKSAITTFDQYRPASWSSTISQFFVTLRCTLDSERVTAVSTNKQMSKKTHYIYAKQLIIQVSILVFQLRLMSLTCNAMPWLILLTVVYH